MSVGAGDQGSETGTRVPSAQATGMAGAQSSVSDSTPGPRIALCAGETSGDALGAGLIAALRRRLPETQFVGIGGQAMRAAGMHTWHDARALAVMGLSEVVAHLPRLLRLRRGFRQQVLAWQPDLFIGIDAPDFNLGLERWLKTYAIPTLHYVSPSIWAWRENRAAKLGRSVDRVLCLFPMEPEIYARYGVDARFVGHPLADTIALDPDRAGARRSLGMAFHPPLLALLPGSRLGEITRMLPIFLDAAALVAQRVSGLIVLIPAADPQCKLAISALLQQSRGNGRLSGLDVRVLDGQAREAMIASDVVLLASGTAALEAMLCKRPMVVGHRIAAASYRLVRALGLLKTRWVSLPNLLAGTSLVPELLQDECTPERIASAVLQWFDSPEAVAALRPRFRAIHEALRRDASERAADEVLDCLKRRDSQQSTATAEL